MTAHCDFEEQVHVIGSEGALRPDMVVHLPEGRDVVVDVKTPLDAYLAAAEAPSDELREAALKRHAQHVAERVRLLSSKNYAAQFAQAPQFVVLFLPGDQFLSSALDQQPELLDRAMSSNIILTTPSTLLALLKAVHNGWQNMKLAENAERIRGLAEELYARLSTFRNHVARIGSALEASVNAFNSAVGSLERSVLPGARKFVELGVRAEKPIEELEPIEVAARVTESAAPRLAPPEEH
jgi:DNA recombination protein RmuC